MLRAQGGCATYSPYVVCLNKKERRYGIAFNNKKIKDFDIPEAFFQVMDDIENGKILQSDSDPNLRIKYVKSYEAYKKRTENMSKVINSIVSNYFGSCLS